MCFNKLFLPEAKQKVSLGKEPSKEQARRLHQRGGTSETLAPAGEEQARRLHQRVRNKRDACTSG